jgi:hypothetical protein
VAKAREKGAAEQSRVEEIMKIINIPGVPELPPVTSERVANAEDSGRLESLEKIAKSILEKMQGIEERIKVLEEVPKNSSFPAVTSGESASQDRLPTKTLGGDAGTITLDPDAVKKNLLNKMWKYLNDQAAA